MNMKIITTVGMSLISNSGISFDKTLEQEEFRQDLFEEKDIKKLEASLLGFINQKGASASAELTSIEKIDPRGEAEIQLLCTETVLSYLCGLVLQKKLGEERAKIRVIKGLQVRDLVKFKREGVSNLLDAIYHIAQQGTYWDDLVLNITGGYKAIIPIMTIIGQVQKLRTCYIFQENEDSKYDLIEIPRMPVDFQVEVFERFEEEFKQFGEKGDGLLGKDSLSHDFLQECAGCLEIDGDDVAINSVGKILWWNYQQQFFSFHCPENIWRETQKQERLLEYLKQSFTQKNLREFHNKVEETHKTMMKKPNDSLRIYWFPHNEKIFVYKTFEDHDAHEQFIRAVPFNESYKLQVIQSSKPIRIKIK